MAAHWTDPQGLVGEGAGLTPGLIECQPCDGLVGWKGGVTDRSIECNVCENARQVAPHVVAI